MMNDQQAAHLLLAWNPGQSPEQMGGRIGLAVLCGMPFGGHPSAGWDPVLAPIAFASLTEFSMGLAVLCGMPFGGHPSAGWDPVLAPIAFASLTGFSPSRE
jgi:hypothetical protein